MSLFSNIFGSSDNKGTNRSSLAWNTLTQLKQLDAIAEESKEKPVAIFKHSTRCSISRMALKNFEREYRLDENEASIYFLDLLSYRQISDEIAKKFGVIHQSPQLLLIKDGKAVYHASHSEINAASLKDQIL
ncbi:MAG TPA: bacillithiol system redox-active protein YtxJ [Flavobacterium sp.]|nr:bacillithiol system redox-active protein YtxJ [Flavobacterium sp.]